MDTIRQPAAEGFYPGDLHGQLQRFIKGFSPPEQLPSTRIGAILPHAGWMYSGQVAARTLKCLDTGNRPKSCIILGTDHVGVHAHGLYPEGAWQTPLGLIGIDEALGLSIINEMNGLVQADSSAHRWEHSIEVLVPMLKFFWPEIRIVPIIVRAEPSCTQLGRILGQMIQGMDQKPLLLASSDLTHYGSIYGMTPAGTGESGLRWLKNNDHRMVEMMCHADGMGVFKEAGQNRNACGAGAVAALLSTVHELGVKCGYLIEYATSHGEGSESSFSTGVGYAGIVY